MNLYEAISAELEKSPTAQPITIARRLVRIVPQSALVQLVADEVARVQRVRVRAVEREAFKDWASSSPAPSSSARRSSSPVDPLGPFRALLREPFALGDTKEVTYGEATVEQHEQRIAMLTKLRTGLDRTIEQHRDAIQRIESAGVTCLDDLIEQRKAS